MSNRDVSLDPKIIESAKNEFLKKGFIEASLKDIARHRLKILRVMQM